MANLVSPGYKNSSLLRNLEKNEERVIEFKGLNVRNYNDEGEMPDMLNLTMDDFPLLSPRQPRGEVRYGSPYDPEHPLGEIVKPIQILARHNRLAIIGTDDDEDVYFWYDGTKVNKVNNLTSSSRMVAINTKICFFPQKTYLEITTSGNSYTIGDYGNLECSQDVSALDVTISNEDARITLADDYDFGYDDAINIVGTLAYKDANNQSQTATCVVSCIIEEVIKTSSPKTTTLVLPRETFIEMTGEGASQIKLTGTISRTMPTLDHIIEWNNRLWGACNSDNTIYACKLGDPKNWQYYQGTGLDSYYAQQGTDGAFTGVGAYSSHIIFFKADSMCRIYGTAPANYQVTNTKAYGVEDGSAQSVVTINDTVFYKSMIGIMAYSGGIPVCISEKLGDEFRNVIAGTEGQKYYASIQRTGHDSKFEMLVFDTEKGAWMKEDELRSRGFCTVNNRLHSIAYDSETLYCDNTVYVEPDLVCGEGNTQGSIYIMNPVDPTESKDTMNWAAVFGPFHEYLESKKIYSQISLRLKANGPSNAAVYISIDEGPWEHVKTFTTAETGGDIIPIIPRRCDRYSIKINGTGNCEIVSLTRRVRRGTFGKL